jgi:hypothetical protein
VKVLKMETLVPLYAPANALPNGVFGSIGGSDISPVAVEVEVELTSWVDVTAVEAPVDPVEVVVSVEVIASDVAAGAVEVVAVVEVIAADSVAAGASVGAAASVGAGASVAAAAAVGGTVVGLALLPPQAPRNSVAPTKTLNPHERLRLIDSFLSC